MASPANRASGSGDTNKPKKPKVKAPAKKPAAKAPPASGPYQWNGKGHHSISQADHAMHVEDPLTKDPLYASAKQQAQSFYAPQSNALDTQIRNAPGYYTAYMNTARGAGTAAATYSQPVINNARTFATNINTPAAGLDPNSPEYQKSQQAGKGISALAEFGAQNLEGNQAADQTYFQGQATNAAATLPGVLANYQTLKGQLGSQIAGKTQELYQGLHAQAVNEDIARQTLGVNAAKAGGYDPLTGKKLPADPVSASDKKTQAELDYFDKHGYWPSTGPPKPKGPTDAQTRADAKDAAKKAKAIQTATGKAKVKVKDIEKAWANGGTIATEVEDTSQPPNLLTGQRPKKKGSRPMTREELRKALGSKYGAEWVSIMERVRKGVPITQDQIDYLHGTDPDLRVPKDWIKGRSKPKTGSRGVSGEKNTSSKTDPYGSGPGHH